jgi:3-deoxy-D-manno-octulosonate 8-phosphate phosphatase (KDO 8-P phosphatase)
MTPPSAPAGFDERARRVRLACFDVDGTLTDGRLTYDSEGRESKSFHVHDGQGLVLLRRAGVRVALVTARHSTIVERRAAELGVDACTGIGDKLSCVEGIARAHGIALGEVAFMGDDLPDLRVMTHVGLSGCPSDAHPWIRERAAWRSRRAGGSGAAREFVDAILLAQGRVESIIAALLDPAPIALGTQS